MATIKQTFSAPGFSSVVPTPNAIYHAVFTGATGTAQLEVLLGGDWIPVIAAIAASMTFPAFFGKTAVSADVAEHLSWRWNIVTLSAGTITVYLG